MWLKKDASLIGNGFSHFWWLWEKGSGVFCQSKGSAILLSHNLQMKHNFNHLTTRRKSIKHIKQHSPSTMPIMSRTIIILDPIQWFTRRQPSSLHLWVKKHKIKFSKNPAITHYYDNILGTGKNFSRCWPLCGERQSVSYNKVKNQPIEMYTNSPTYSAFLSLLYC